MSLASSSVAPVWHMAIWLLFMAHCSSACHDTVYVGTRGGQVAISKDGGDTWSTVLNNGGLMFFSVSAHGGHVYAGTTYGLSVSHNGGASWTVKTLQTNSSCDSTVTSIFVDDEETRVYALFGVNKGCGRVAISSDNGDNWPINFPLPNTRFGSPNNIYVDGPRIYVASSNGLGYTDDLGTTWTFKDASSGLGWNNVMCVIGRGQTIYAGLGVDGGAVSMSKDGGRTWKMVNTAPTGLNDWVQSMYFHANTLYVATMGGGLSFSSDFSTWTRKTTADGLADNSTYAISGSGNNLYLGTNSGLSISRDNGQTWITKTTNNGLPANWINAVFARGSLGLG